MYVFLNCFNLISSWCQIELVGGQIMASRPPQWERKSMKENMTKEGKGRVGVKRHSGRVKVMKGEEHERMGI